MTRVSVALCTFNGARFLETQLTSILNQTRLPDEVVVSDDGSTDETLAVVERVWRSHPSAVSVQLIRLAEGNVGVTANFERAIRATTGDIIVLSDQDDEWRSDRIEGALAVFETSDDVVLHFGDALLIDAKGNPIGGTLFDALEISPVDLEMVRGRNAFSVLLRRNLVTGATTAFRRTLLGAALPFDPDWVHDEWLAIVAAASGRIEFSTTPRLGYRQHGANAIGARKPTLRYKVHRVLEPRGDRYETLARKFASLAARMGAAGAAEPIIREAQRKAQHEATRAGLPASRLRRWPTIAKLARAGAYERYSSRGRLDILRDLLQPK